VWQRAEDYREDLTCSFAYFARFFKNKFDAIWRTLMCADCSYAIFWPVKFHTPPYFPAHTAARIPNLF